MLRLSYSSRSLNADRSRYLKAHYKIVFLEYFYLRGIFNTKKIRFIFSKLSNLNQATISLSIS
ncbi:hypothetical protein ATCC19606_17240 [Acinetobacter baumannii]|uniref:Uncharacterized protein n=1 Tax=Acinetobacter baumannii TaxID=470 RepID=A0A6F8TGH0_ACIBA|nr:hypothetical protein ATCC19606_17240 [Acinetobacter baumannii]